jgi:hypothetical protein
MSFLFMGFLLLKQLMHFAFIDSKINFHYFNILPYTFFVFSALKKSVSEFGAIELTIFLERSSYLGLVIA